MIVCDTQNKRQQSVTPRKERRPDIVRLQKEKRKLRQKLKAVNLNIEFGNETTTAFGNFSLIERFKKAVGISDIINEKLSVKKHHNTCYGAATLTDYMIDACILGKTRFDHIEALGCDPGYLKLKGIDRFPSEGRFRDLMSRMEQEHIDELMEINRQIVELKSQHEGAKEVWFDYDDTVITLFGSQSEGNVGYNPRYHGRPSYKAKVCFIAETDELLHLDLYPGTTHSNGCFLDFHHTCENLLPHNYVLKGIRGDRGFMGEDNIHYFEERCLEYVIKLKMTGRLRTQILALPDYLWKDLDDNYSVAQMEYLPTGWQFPRKVAVIRERQVEYTEQLYLPVKETYKYQAIMTNMEAEPEAVWRFYNKRGQAENKIGEIKEGFGVDETSQSVMMKNRAFALIKTISYNVTNWFRCAAMPGIRYEITTIRRKIVNVPGNLVGQGWYRRIKLAPNRWLEKTVGWIKQNLETFFDFVANGFKPLGS